MTTDKEAREEEAYELMELLTRWCHQTDDIDEKELYRKHLRNMEQDLGLLDE